MKKFYLILGNITFHSFTEDELNLFKNDTEQKALVHEMLSVQAFDNEGDATEWGEDSLCNVCESYVVVGAFNGEIVFENSTDEVLFKQWKDVK